MLKMILGMIVEHPVRTVLVVLGTIVVTGLGVGGWMAVKLYIGSSEDKYEDEQWGEDSKYSPKEVR